MILNIVKKDVVTIFHNFEKMDYKQLEEVFENYHLNDFKNFNDYYVGYIGKKMPINKIDFWIHFMNYMREMFYFLMKLMTIMKMN